MKNLNKNNAKVVSDFFSKIPSVNSEMMMTIPRETQLNGGVVIMSYNKLVDMIWEMIDKLEEVK